MLSKKIFLSAALVSMAGLVACGDDSSSNSGDDKLPEKVKTIQEANDLKCDESVKCAKVFVEEEIVNDYFQCDGSQWFPATDAKFKDLCPAEDKKAEGEEKGEGEGEKTPESSASTPTSTNSDATSTDSSDSTGDSADSNTGSSDSAVASSESGATSTDSGSGEMISCDGIEGAPGTPSCLEVPVSDTEKANAMKEQCGPILGGTLGTGCPANAVN